MGSIRFNQRSQFKLPFQGQFFSGNDHRIYLLGNPVIWWGNIVFLGVFTTTFVWNSILAQRGHGDSPEVKAQKNRTLYAGVWLFIGWALHYIPFWAMGRVLYFHHYFPACLFSSMLTAVILEYILNTILQFIPERLVQVVYHSFIGIFVGTLWYRYVNILKTPFFEDQFLVKLVIQPFSSFHLFSPLAYGMEATPGHMANSSVHHLKWIDSWEF